MVDIKKFHLRKLRFFSTLVFAIVFSLILATSSSAWFFDFLFEPELAEVVNSQPIDSSYLEIYNNYGEVEFESVNEKINSIMKIGATVDNIRGYELNSLGYVVHLIYCDKSSNSCNFRINGVPTGKLYALDTLDKEDIVKSFDIDDEYQLKIDSIEFDYCDGLRFCNLHFEAYEIVKVSVEKVN